MAEILMFHHALGLTDGVVAFADELRAAGHTVHTPDLYDGKILGSVDEGVAHAKSIGFGEILERGKRVGEAMPAGMVYAGFSMGIMPAQLLTQTRPDAKGALFYHGAIPLDEFGGAWPTGVPLQIHTMEDDDWGDVDVARELEKTVAEAELFIYPGNRHLFTDRSASEYDESAASLVMERTLSFLARIR